MLVEADDFESPFSIVMVRVEKPSVEDGNFLQVEKRNPR